MENLGGQGTGGILNGLSNFLIGTPGKSQQFPRFTPPQQNVQNQALQNALSYLQGGSQLSNSFEPIAQQARNRFNTQTIPSLAERFTSLGDSAQRSSAFQGSLGSAAAGLEEGLAAQQSARNDDLLKLLLSIGLQPSFESAYTPSQPGFFHGLASGLGSIAGLSGGSGILNLLSLLGR